MDFKARWVGLLKDFKDISGDSSVRYETFVDRMFKQKISNESTGFLERDRIQFTEEEDSESQLQDYLVGGQNDQNHDEGDKV